MVLWIAFNRANDSNSSAIFFLRPSIDKEKSAVGRSHWPRFRDAFTMAAINSRRNRRALHAESRDADSAFVAKETFTTRGKSTIRSISRKEERYAIKSRHPGGRIAPGFSLRERERGREIDQGQRSGTRDLARLLKRVTWMI